MRRHRAVTRLGIVMSEGTGSAAQPENSLSVRSPVGTVPQAQRRLGGKTARHSRIIGNRQVGLESGYIWLALIAIAGAAGAFVLYGLTRSPVTWDDEVFFAEPARMLATSGSLAAPQFFDIAGLNHYFFVQPPVYFLLMAGAYRVFGFSDTAARLGSAVPYIAGIVVVFYLARSIANRVGLDRRLSSVAGLLAAFLISFNEQSIEMARSARGDSLGLLLLLLGWCCVCAVTKNASNRKTLWISSSFALLLLAALTHPALGGPAVGIMAVAICRPASLGISRRTALTGVLASSVLVMLPYGIWAIVHFNDWRSQFLHTIVSAGAGHYGNFLSAQAGNAAAFVKYSPMITVAILFGLATFRWRMCPDAAGAVIGMVAVTVASTDPYMKFLLVISLAPAVAGITLLSTKVRRSFRQLTAVLVLLACLNGLAFAVLRAYEIHKYYWQRDPMLVSRNIQRFVPHGAHLMGISGVYFAALSAGAEFREYQLLEGVTYGSSAYLQAEFPALQAQFRRDVGQYNPTWFALPLGMRPDRSYCFLPDRFREVSVVNVPISSGFNSGGQSRVAYALWTVTSTGVKPDC
jgi:4-amino-4-deoxy-L-arabinose transferase-like glycosyltransferase